MGSFWGMNDAGKEAGGWAREYGAWNKGQFQDWLDRQNRYGDLADFYTNGANDYWTERRNDGFASPEQITATGQQISPWVQDFIQNQRNRRGAIRDREGGRRTADDYTGEMSGRLDEIGRNIGNAYTDAEGEINDTSGRMMGREEGAFGDVVGNVKDSAGSMRAAVNDTFGGLRQGNVSTYGGIRDRGKTSFAQQVKNLSAIMPGGQAQAARVGRSFAPQMADTLTRLRRAGVDPNSPEAAALLRGVETARSRAMDDATGDATLSYVDRSNSVLNSELGFMTDADRAQFENEAGLATGQVDRSNRISGDEADRFQAAVYRRSDNLNSVDRDRSARTIDNQDKGFSRGADLLMERNNLTNFNRQANMQDVDRMNDIDIGDGQSELEAGGVYDNQFDRGMTWTAADRAVRDNANTNLGRSGTQYRNHMFQAANTAGGFGDRAFQSYETAYAREAPKAGWGSRLLGGLASAAIGMIPGGGTAMTALRGFGGAAAQAIGGAQGAPGGGGGYGGGSWGGGGYAPVNAQTPPFMNPQMFQMPRYTPQPAYSQTRSLPNGDFQVNTSRRSW